MKTKTQAIFEFLQTQPCKVDLYHPALEVQVNVVPGKERIPRAKGFDWTDGVETWSAFRVPYAGSGIDAEPHYTDVPLTWTFDKYVEAIGLTGWNWQKRLSLWVGFDFDSAFNHTKGLTDSELDSLRQRIKEVPWIELRRSKSGRGYHLYVHLETPVETRNHAEHAALAKSILSHLSGLLQFDFGEKVDTCGGVLWIWHREASEDRSSFELIKAAKCKLSHVPDGWRDYLEVQRSKRRVPRKLKEHEDKFADLMSRTRKTTLDEQHHELLKWLTNSNFTSWWDAERDMLVCHTSALKQAHADLKMKGVFETAATGKDSPYDHNCFCFPIRNGAWSVFRYSPGAQEHEYWSKTPQGWTTCILNKLPDLSSASRLYRGVKTKTGEYKFKEYIQANKALTLIGVTVNAPKIFDLRETTLSPGKAENEVVISVPYEDTDPPQIDWYIGGRGKSRRWERVANSIVEAKVIEAPDEVIRHVTKPTGRPAWYVLSRGRWIEKGKDDVRSAMTALDYKPGEIDRMLGMAVLEDWEEVCLPFEQEYPGDRRWNRDAPQFSTEPRYGPHPTWDLILSHIGAGFNVEGNEWCRVNNITSGDQYLRLWLASMFRHPFEPLPYLFLWGPQNSGKSILHEGVQLLLRDARGYAKADQALVNTSGFNGELYGAILAVVEEVDVSSKTALDRVKDWVTGRQIFIRALHKDGFTTPNSTHWIQCSNDASYCPIFPGDTRISVGYVDIFSGPEIPKPDLLSRLQSEAGSFIYSLLRCEIPPSTSRLRIPVLDSALKSELADTRRNAVLEFLEAQCVDAPGILLYADMFVSNFINWCPPAEQGQWTRDKIIKEIPIGKIVKGTYNGQLAIGNLAIKGVEGKRLKTERINRVGRKLE